MTNFKARKTIYKGVEMRSRLEAGFAAWLDDWSFTWEYEPAAFGSNDGQYLPDFRLDAVEVMGCGPQRVYVEVKPSNWDDPDALLDQMQIIRDSDPAAVLLLVQQGHGPAIATHSFSPNFLSFTAARWTFAGPRPTPTLGLAIVLPEACGPWPDGYWKPRAARPQWDAPF